MVPSISTSGPQLLSRSQENLAVGTQHPQDRVVGLEQLYLGRAERSLQVHGLGANSAAPTNSNQAAVSASSTASLCSGLESGLVI